MCRRVYWYKLTKGGERVDDGLMVVPFWRGEAYARKRIRQHAALHYREGADWDTLTMWFVDRETMNH